MGKEIKMSKLYFVKLKPMGKFFFGGDMRFEVNGKEEEFSSYIIESSMMPQQTSLLGMMRFLLLSNDENLFDVKENVIKSGKMKAVSEKIGERSFSVNPDGAMNSFGDILSLGPCCLYGNNECYYRASADDAFSSFGWTGVKAMINGKEVEIPELKIMKENKEELYTGKVELSPCFKSFTTGEVEKEEEWDENGEAIGLFIKDSRIGIDKDYDGKKKTKAFYKQISYRLKDGFCFAFEVEVNDGIKLEEFNGQIVKLGADASSFVFEAEETQPSVKGNKEGLSVVLLSDAYISKEDMETANIRFSINQIRPFRFLKTVNQEDASYYRINGKKTATCTERYELYQAGSVFYFKDDADRNTFVKVLESREDFNQIGYNKFYIK